jgi:hypothetical protein
LGGVEEGGGVDVDGAAFEAPSAADAGFWVGGEFGVGDVEGEFAGGDAGVGGDFLIAEEVAGADGVVGGAEA